jgi:DNA-binding HxlR family transcriptional regulator
MIKDRRKLSIMERQREAVSLVYEWIPSDKEIRHKELKGEIRANKMSPATLDKYLKRLERWGVVERKVDPSSYPPSVTYKRTGMPFDKAMAEEGKYKEVVIGLKDLLNDPKEEFFWREKSGLIIKSFERALWIESTRDLKEHMWKGDFCDFYKLEIHRRIKEEVSAELGLPNSGIWNDDMIWHHFWNAVEGYIEGYAGFLIQEFVWKKIKEKMKPEIIFELPKEELIKKIKKAYL